MDKSDRPDAITPQSEPQLANQKRAYQPPAIEDFGSVADLTAGSPMTRMAEVLTNGYSTSAM